MKLINGEQSLTKKIVDQLLADVNEAQARALRPHARWCLVDLTLRDSPSFVCATCLLCTGLRQRVVCRQRLRHSRRSNARRASLVSERNAPHRKRVLHTNDSLNVRTHTTHIHTHTACCNETRVLNVMRMRWLHCSASFVSGAIPALSVSRRCVVCRSL